MTDRRYRVLVLGGTGVFGRRVCRRLAEYSGFSVILTSRRAARAETLAAQLRAQQPASQVEGVGLDDLTAGVDKLLAAHRVDLVIHAAGPFQGQDYQVAECCIGRGAHYLDLADGRDFVCGFERLDAPARRARVVAVTGASSVPGLSSVVVDQLTEGAEEVHSIAVGISPGNRAPLGAGAIAGVLSYGGRPIRQWRDGHWQQAYGLQDLHRRSIAGLGSRWLSACDVPDLTLFHARYPSARTITFHAGLELSGMMFCLWGLSWLVRGHLIPSLSLLARWGGVVAELVKPLGSDRGGMFVEVVTTNAGRRRRHTWTLIAERNHGPYVPCLPVVILARRLAAGHSPSPGARPCLGLFTLSDLSQACQDLAITWHRRDDGA